MESVWCRIPVHGVSPLRTSAFCLKPHMCNSGQTCVVITPYTQFAGGVPSAGPSVALGASIDGPEA